MTEEIESRLAAHFDDADDFLWRCGEQEEEAKLGEIEGGGRQG